MVPRVFCNRLDPSSVDGMSAKIGLDATMPPNFDGERIRLPEHSVDWARQFLSRHIR
jgi:3-polyprenyl-4-hydroxybenzoate decarboxylase